jgi:hypothetical protein
MHFTVSSLVGLYHALRGKVTTDDWVRGDTEIENVSFSKSFMSLRRSASRKRGHR